MKLYTEDQINKLLEESNTIVQFKDAFAKLPEESLCIIDTVKIEEDDTITIMVPESFLNTYEDDVHLWIQNIQNKYPNNPVLAILSDIDVLIQNSDEALEMLDGMKAKISIMRDTPADKQIIV